MIQLKIKWVSQINKHIRTCILTYSVMSGWNGIHSNTFYDSICLQKNNTADISFFSNVFDLSFLFKFFSNSRSSDEVLHILGNILGALQRGRTSLVIPKKKPIDELMKSRNMVISCQIYTIMINNNNNNHN